MRFTIIRGVLGIPVLNDGKHACIPRDDVAGALQSTCKMTLKSLRCGKPTARKAELEKAKRHAQDGHLQVISEVTTLIATGWVHFTGETHQHIINFGKVFPIVSLHLKQVRELCCSDPKELLPAGT